MTATTHLYPIAEEFNFTFIAEEFNSTFIAKEFNSTFIAEEFNSTFIAEEFNSTSIAEELLIVAGKPVVAVVASRLLPICPSIAEELARPAAPKESCIEPAAPTCKHKQNTSGSKVLLMITFESRMIIQNISRGVVGYDLNNISPSNILPVMP